MIKTNISCIGADGSSPVPTIVFHFVQSRGQAGKLNLAMLGDLVDETAETCCQIIKNDVVNISGVQWDKRKL